MTRGEVNPGRPPTRANASPVVMVGFFQAGSVKSSPRGVGGVGLGAASFRGRPGLRGGVVGTVVRYGISSYPALIRRPSACSHRACLGGVTFGQGDALARVGNKHVATRLDTD